MAATGNRSGDITYVSMPIMKWEDGPDGSLYVYGRATTPEIDTDDQVVSSAFSGKALKEWLATAPALRVQHNGQRDPAGSGVKVEIDRDGDGAHWVKSVVDEPVAQRLVKKGHLRAYSVGIANPVIERDVTGKARGGVITAGKIFELSLVDSPANRSCFLELCKSDTSGQAEFTGKMFGDADLLTKVKKPAGDGDGDSGSDDATDDAADDQDPDANDTGSADADQDDADDAEKAYSHAVAVHKASEPRRDVLAGNGTEFLRSVAAWKRWDEQGDTEGLDDTPAGFDRWTAKRAKDPDVGGGVDRDTIPDADHVDPDGRRFPIVKPGDVSDAVSSYGRAKPLIPMKKFRKRLQAIASRKGPDFVKQLPDSWSKAAEPDATKDVTLTSPNPTGLVPYNLQGQEKPNAEDDSATTKGAKDCPSCGAGHDADSKLRRCTSCGKKLPKGDAVSKSARMVPADVAEAGKHREPDGSAVEALEADAGMHTGPDHVAEHIPASVKSASATPYQLQRMHDAMCAAYHWDDVAGEYPSLKGVSDAVVPAWFRDQVTDAATKGDMATVSELAAVASNADIVAKGLVDPAVLADGRGQLHKSFADMYPTEHIKPGSITPGQFQRPYINAGHAPLSASGSRPSAVPPSTHVPDPNDFSRGLITAGHEAASPADKGNNLATASVSSGSARSYYTSASKEAARGAMQSMHDRIAATTPDMCPMAPSRTVMPPDMGDTNAPKTIAPLVTPKVPGEKAAEATVTKAVTTSGLSTKQVAKLVKSAARDAAKVTAGLYEEKITALQAEIDALGAQPDPAQAPLRGVVSKAATSKEATPVEKPSLVQKARNEKAAEDAEYVQYLQVQAASDNPARREQAERILGEVLSATP